MRQKTAVRKGDKMKPYVSHIIKCVLFILGAVFWSSVCIYGQVWVGLALNIVFLVFAVHYGIEASTSIKYYKKYLAEERAKLGLDDMPIDTEDSELDDEDDDEEYAEYLEYAQEIEELEEYDSDSGKGYCPHCGNYSVSDGSCEICGEKVTE